MKIFPATLFNFIIIWLKYSASHVKEVEGSIFLQSHVSIYTFIFLFLFLFRVFHPPSCLSKISGKLLSISHLNILVYSKRIIQNFCLEVLHALYRDFFLNDPWYQLHFNPLNAELNPICHLMALLRAHPILHVSRIRVNSRDDTLSNDRRNSFSP